MPLLRSIASALIAIATAATTPVLAEGGSIIVQSTTSTKNSGLYDYLLPKFKAATGITVHVVAVGTGQAIRNARNCDGDMLLVHAKSDEQKFVADGFGTKRYDLMYNDFIIVGPPTDPAEVLTYINRTLCKVADPSFVTALYAVFDAAQRTLRFARAGHPPPMIYRREENKSIELTGKGVFPMGIYPYDQVPVHETRLGSGDRFLLYTDGVTERFNMEGDA